MASVYLGLNSRWWELLSVWVREAIRVSLRGFIYWFIHFEKKRFKSIQSFIRKSTNISKSLQVIDTLNQRRKWRRGAPCVWVLEFVAHQLNRKTPVAPSSGCDIRSFRLTSRTDVVHWSLTVTLWCVGAEHNYATWWWIHSSPEAFLMSPKRAPEKSCDDIQL